jgi:PAT family beta-lactamase induction signal transducer AmpG
MAKNTKTNASPWTWVPSLYLAEGLPYAAVMTVSLIMYKRMGISNADIAFYTSWLHLPWIIKPFWSPFVDLLKTKRWWIVAMQLFLGAGFAGIAFTVPLPFFFRYTLAFFWLTAFISATHDIAADGFYMLGLNTGQQAMYVGIRSTFYRLATITGQGALVILAGFLEKASGNISFAWSVTFFVLAGLLLLFSLLSFSLSPPLSSVSLVLSPSPFSSSSSSDSCLLHVLLSLLFLPNWNSKE